MSVEAAAAEAGTSRSQVLAVLRAHKDELARRFGVERLSLFGSFSRDYADDGSDIDILVRLRSEFRPYVEAEAVHV